MSNWQRIPAPEAAQAVVFPLALRKGAISIPAQGFAVATDEGYRAYVNRCPHAGAPLDWDDGDFFDEEGLLLCRMHGARFLPATGQCVAGPCQRASLQPLTLREEGRWLWVPKSIDQ